ncbi:Cytochrome P450 2U1 [Lamellibrachia satsuma]|nr:Cytochrome P450 2U1 [Lamellibrachia satsuma]
MVTNGKRNSRLNPQHVYERQTFPYYVHSFAGDIVKLGVGVLCTPTDTSIVHGPTTAASCNMTVFAAWVDYLDTSTLLIFLVVFLCGLWLLSTAGGQANWPPGPKSWPVIGNVDVFWNNPQLYMTFTELAKTYGEMIHLRVGLGIHVVVLSGHDVIREAFADKGVYFSNRLTFPSILKYTCNGKGIVMQNGDDWKTLRRFTQRALKDFGVGKSSLEEKIKDEIEAVQVELDKQRGSPFDPKQLFDKAVSNIICSIIFGERYSYDHEEFQHLHSSMNYMFKNSGPKHVAHNLLPGPLAFALIPSFRKFVKVDCEIKEFVRKRISEHRETFVEASLRDFIDFYIKAEKLGEDSGAFSDENMFQVIVDLLLAGSETTSTTLYWAFLFMILNPDIQAKCREEILQVIGQDRVPGMTDRGTLPFTEAAILEIHRCGSIAPTALGHVVVESITFRGYDLPKGTLVFANLYQTHMDPTMWKDPLTFNPGRWLDENNMLKNNPAFMPFCVGSRKCLGDSLAKMEMFLFMTTLLQRFDFRIVDADNPPSTDGIQGITRSPHKYELIATRT